MNERIKQLAEQAGIEEWWDSGNECREVLQEHLEKFAELIVRECAGIIESQDVDPSFKNRRIMSWAVKQHFGVEK